MTPEGHYTPIAATIERTGIRLDVEGYCRLVLVVDAGGQLFISLGDKDGRTGRELAIIRLASFKQEDK